LDFFAPPQPHPQPPVDFFSSFFSFLSSDFLHAIIYHSHPKYIRFLNAAKNKKRILGLFQIQAKYGV